LQANDIHLIVEELAQRGVGYWHINDTDTNEIINNCFADLAGRNQIVLQ
jgi:hypothetical protein